MAGETTITLVGNLTADPELRFTPSGAAVANFTVASTPRTFDRQTNEWRDGDAMFLTVRCGARLQKTSPNHCKRACGSSCRAGSGRAVTRPEKVSGARFSRSTWTRSARRCVTPRRRSRGMSVAVTKAGTAALRRAAPATTRGPAERPALPARVRSKAPIPGRHPRATSPRSDHKVIT